MKIGATLVLLALLGTGCRSAAPVPEPAGYTLVLLKTGPNGEKLSKTEREQAFAGHFANMERLANARQLLVAGPFGNERHDPALRGLFVLATSDRSEAESWASTDPTTRAGVFVLEYHDLATDAPLLGALERDLARAAQRKASEAADPTEGMRSYVLLTAEHGDLAERELATLVTSAGGVFLLGHLDGSRAFAILDAESVAEARARFERELDGLGAHELDSWFASDELARMVAPHPDRE